MAFRSSMLLSILVIVLVIYQAQSFPAEFERRTSAAQIQQELDLIRKILDSATDKELADLNAMSKACLTKNNKALDGILPTLVEDAFAAEKAGASGRRKRNIYEEFFKRSRQSDLDEILKNTKAALEGATDLENSNTLKFEQLAVQGSAADKSQLLHLGEQFTKLCNVVAKRVELFLYRRILELDI